MSEEREYEYMEDDPAYRDWQYEVANGDTRLGLDEWKMHQRAAARFNAEFEAAEEAKRGGRDVDGL
jgi:hypothetical protein